MDIVSRLKKFMSSLDMTSSQFADTCRIPRPSLSQLLNGRNKKVSDEIVTKIHDSFPELSVLWLLFGEGTMVVDSNIQISDAQNDLFSDQTATQNIENQMFEMNEPSTDNNINISSNNFNPISTPHNTPKAIKLNPATNKKITNIVVFYDDNSFESFSPS